MEVKNLCKAYGDLPVLENVSFTVGVGVTALWGPSGVGKTTLLRILLGLEKPDSGELMGTAVRWSAVFQEDRLCETFSAVDNVLMTSPSSMSRAEVRRELMELLPEEVLDRPAATLSGGQKRRVAIAGVLAMQPEVLILDEPTAGLDPAGRTEILELLKKLHEENNITVILVSHSMDDVARYAGRILVMNQGELVLDGEPRKVFRYRDELRKIGLDVPQSTNILYELRDRGMAVGTEGITPEQAAECIADSLRRQS